MNKNNTRPFFILLMFLFILFLFQSCTGKIHKAPMDRFIGTWQLQGRSMFNGIKVNIEKKHDKYLGKVVGLNKNRWVMMFLDTGDVWVNNITRLSNFEFKITEKKLAAPLFSEYGENTTRSFRSVFIAGDTIALGKKNENLENSKVRYIRVME